MSHPIYSEIPDTSDLTYWSIKAQDGQLRCVTFVPRDKELHQQLKRKAWAAKAPTARNRKH
ncbi:hypothetical protein GO755_27780 [Spirosoma sp. HMF4905]|uniref:Uncharacterized protein n=1 Tax=Spirosoma arboris TaxID=2682092 RepID=A0A7K1SJG3_9BACT|nr:hypothetical protein [Spirosoma arboris]MVM33868.1 hypothetical protein [Spirosoma arboris]